MVQLMPLHLIISCFIKIQIRLTFLVPAYPGCPVKEAIKQLSVCLFISTSITSINICLQCFDAVGWAVELTCCSFTALNI